MAVRMNLRSCTTWMTLVALLLSTAVTPAVAKDRWRHMAYAATAAAKRGGFVEPKPDSPLAQVAKDVEQQAQATEVAAEEKQVIEEDTAKIDELEAEKQVLEEQVDQSFGTRLADALTGNADDYTPLMWLFAFGIVIVVVSAATGMVIMSSIIKGSVGRAENGQMNDLNFLKLKQRAQGLSVKNIKGAKGPTKV